MHLTRIRHRLTLALAACVMAACGGGDRNAASPDPAAAGDAATATVEIRGQARTGTPVGHATVSAVNRRGQRFATASSADGSFTLHVAEAAPYLLSASDAVGQTWYSYAPGPGRFDLTPLTTLALLQANGHRPLSDLATAWQAQAPSDAQVLEGARIVAANLAPLLASQGLAPTNINVFTHHDDAEGVGLDALLDGMHISIDCNASACSERITSPGGSTPLSWNAAIATQGFSFTWASDSDSGSVALGVGSCTAPKPGTYSLVVQTTVSGAGATASPELCIDGLPSKPGTPSEFCGSETVTRRLPLGAATLSCTYDGTSGMISARINAPLRIDYTVKFTFVKR